MPEPGLLLKPSAAATSSAPMRTTLSRMGAAAAMLKRPSELNTPDSRATSEMHSR
jgi:hypothetical protein